MQPFFYKKYHIKHRKGGIAFEIYNRIIWESDYSWAGGNDHDFRPGA